MCRFGKVLGVCPLAIDRATERVRVICDDTNQHLLCGNRANEAISSQFMVRHRARRSDVVVFGVQYIGVGVTEKNPKPTERGLEISYNTDQSTFFK